MRSRFSLLAICLLAGCAAAPSKPHTAVDSELIDAEVTRLMQREQVEGMALAIVEEGQVVKVAAYGMRNSAQGLPLTPQTIMYGASLTKALFAYMVMQLVDEGRLDLDDTVETLLPRPLPEYRRRNDDYLDLAADDRWRKLTPRILLDHSTGFANFRWVEPDQKLRFHFDPGTRYAYSGEGIYVLQIILEQGLGLDVGKEMQRRVFDRFGMVKTSMTWRADFARNFADGYQLDGTMQPHDQRSHVSAAGSMDTTISDQAKFWAGLVRGDGLSSNSRREMVKSQIAITSKHQFPTLSSEVDPDNSTLGLAAGLGVVAFEDGTGPAWFKGGHNDSTGNMVICLEAHWRCLVMLGNDIRAERIYPEVAKLVLGRTRMPWSWEYDWVGTIPAH